MSSINHDGIEYVTPGIFKAQQREWAEDFLKKGTIYFINLEVFQRDEHLERGDIQEGVAVVNKEGEEYSADYGNPIFVCCFTMETDPYAILATWDDRDAVLQITDTVALGERVLEAAKKAGVGVHSLSVGPVTYDKDGGSFRKEHWIQGIFQKNLRHSGQKEYRLALVLDAGLKGKGHIVLELGDCTDIARIV